MKGLSTPAPVDGTAAGSSENTRRIEADLLGAAHRGTLADIQALSTKYSTDRLAERGNPGGHIVERGCHEEVGLTHIIWAGIIVESGAEIWHRARKHNDLKYRALREDRDRLLHRPYLSSRLSSRHGSNRGFGATDLPSRLLVERSWLNFAQSTCAAVYVEGFQRYDLDTLISSLADDVLLAPPLATVPSNGH
ncbi:hypothetical protein THAOC_27640 [Thalassiosira oceanica]|uniref:Uncharacterized protein n=1 Tax=Thalassiosira oceanica TaxID=159749 RepID=K0RL37_THAOC|nr:hypothetical protein THAOC_27640 [Thalassiosira oceanica]|eukprot:EJK52999.1 hypothetical protein THAOC_27640 [Thalassiosira oceanica]